MTKLSVSCVYANFSHFTLEFSVFCFLFSVQVSIQTLKKVFTNVNSVKV